MTLASFEDPRGECKMSPSPVTPGDDTSSERRTCILLVEDEVLIRLMLAEELRDAGHQVIEASDADEALVILEATRPDLIISDVRMPGSIDGLGLLALVRASLPALPVIITSAHLGPAHAHSHGANLFVPKPYFCGVMLDAAEELLRGNNDDQG
jgi:CheY-like chemotaxis protein